MGATDSVPPVLLTLPDERRSDLKEPWGPVFEDAAALLDEAGDPLVAVGDVVTYHVERAGRTPDVAVVDAKTERSPAPDHVAEAVGAPDVTVENPPATLTEALLVAVREAIDAEGPVRILVEGEEDLAALPAVLAAPDGASVVYGQPGEGMVLVGITPEARERAEAVLRGMDGEVERALQLLD